MSVMRAISDAALAPLRAATRAFLAPTAEEREEAREDTEALKSQEDRADEARRHVDAHLKERDAQRGRSRP